MKDSKKNKTAKLEIVATRLTALRTELGLNQGELAELFEISQVVVSRLESGQGSSPENLIKVLQFYSSKGYNLEWIIAEDNSEILKKKDLIFSLDFDKETIKTKLQEMIIIGKEMEKIISNM